MESLRILKRHDKCSSYIVQKENTLGSSCDKLKKKK